jgi:predicted ATPase
MRKIKKVKIEGFWGTKTVTLDFNDDINFLIGVNGSGKTTIINMVAASLNADFSTLDKAQFSKIKVDFFELEQDNKKEKSQTYIEVEKIEKENSPYSNIIFNIKMPGVSKIKTYRLNELEEEAFFRYPNEYVIHKRHKLAGQVERDINIALKEIVNLTWLSIHRTSGPIRTSDDKSFESTIDKKINELSTDLVKYFGILDKKYSMETEKFQKNIFLSLIEDETRDDILTITKGLEPDKEKESLKQIFLLFKLKENDFNIKLEKHFKSFESAKAALLKKDIVTLNHLASLIGTRRIHSIVQEWNSLNEMKINIYKPKFTFLNEINNLFLKKKISINERNELFVETESGKIFPLVHLSSGEKQVLIILGQSLLQENKNHVYIADEPELSLHVEWQEKLVSSLKNVNPNSQIIFATHSPDIVGKFFDSVIKVEDVIK